MPLHSVVCDYLAETTGCPTQLARLPIPETTDSDDTVGVLSVVSKAATFFHDQLVKGPFRADTWETFEVDTKVPPEILSSLGRAVNAGAIVLVPSGDKLVLASERDLIGERFRVSYLLAPIYGLTLRLGKPVALTAILSEKRRSLRTCVDNPQLKFD